MIPLYGFLEGDTMGLLVLAHESDTVRELAEKLQQSARPRVARFAPFNVLYKGQLLDASFTLAQARFEALERFDVVRDGT